MSALLTPTEGLAISLLCNAAIWTFFARYRRRREAEVQQLLEEFVRRANEVDERAEIARRMRGGV